MSTEWKLVVAGLVPVAVGGAVGGARHAPEGVGVLVVLAGVYLVYQA